VVPSLPSPSPQSQPVPAPPVPSPALNRSASSRHDGSSPKPRVVEKSSVASRPDSRGSPSDVALAPAEPSSDELPVAPAPPSGSSTPPDEASFAPAPHDQMAVPRYLSPQPLALPPPPPAPRPAR